MVELAVDGVVGEDPVVAVVVGGQVRAPVSVDAVPVEAVEQLVARGQVLDHDAVGLDHLDPVRPLEPAVDDRRVPVLTADRDVRRGDRHLLLVDAGGDQHHAAGADRVDAGLDRRRVPRDAHRVREGRRGWLRARGHGPGRTGKRYVADGDGADHARRRGSRDTGSGTVDAGLVEGARERRAGREVAGVPRSVVGGRRVRRGSLVRPLDGLTRLDPHDLWREHVVERRDRRAGGLRRDAGGRDREPDGHARQEHHHRAPNHRRGR